MQLTTINNQETMSSLDLREIINNARLEFGEKEVENRHFLARVEDELEGELSGRKTFTPARGGTPMGYYDLTIEQCTLVGMRESKGVRRAVLAKLKQLEKPKSPSEILLMHAQRLVDMEREQEQLKMQVAALVEGENFMTVVGYCNLIGKRLDSKSTARMGKLATAVCKAENIEMGKAKHPLYGEINSYPFEVLQQVFGE